MFEATANLMLEHHSCLTGCGLGSGIRKGSRLHVGQKRISRGQHILPTGPLSRSSTYDQSHLDLVRFQTQTALTREK